MLCKAVQALVYNGSLLKLSFRFVSRGFIVAHFLSLCVH